MDGFETIRRQAATLHKKLVAKGTDPFDPLKLVEAAAGELKLELIFLPAGNVVFKNSKALFDEQSGMICCEDGGDDATRALLVAHEIGHVVLHARSSHCDGKDIDPSLSMETAPVGLQRVEDYGAKERRELQANVFGREFLLPRAIARQLFIDDKLTARDIMGIWLMAIIIMGIPVYNHLIQIGALNWDRTPVFNSASLASFRHRRQRPFWILQSSANWFPETAFPLMKSPKAPQMSLSMCPSKVFSPHPPSARSSWRPS